MIVKSMKTDREYGLSEELLAAFEEGRTDAEETRRVIEALAGDPALREEYVLSRKVDALMGGGDGMAVLPLAAMAAESEGNLCDFQCECYVLGRRGIVCDAGALSEQARKNRWLREKGTPLHSIGRLLEQQGLIVMRRFGAEMADIVRAIDAGHDVIVVVDNGAFPYEAATDAAYHAVVVKAVGETEVELYDPAAEADTAVCGRDAFETAWKAANAYLVRVKSRDSDYNPRPIDLDDVELSVDLIDLREAIAENAHEIWADKRQEEGWTYGAKRDDARKRHPDMVPYAMLPDSEKEYDRRMAFDTIRLMKKLGYDLIRRNDTPLHAELLRRIEDEDSARVCECGAYVFLDHSYCPRCGKKLDWKLFL